MGLETRIEASTGGRTEKKKEKEKFPLCESIGHQPLWGRCPKAEAEMHLDDLEAFLNVQGFHEAERIYHACDLEYAPADKKQNSLSNFMR